MNDSQIEYLKDLLIEYNHHLNNYSHVISDDEFLLRQDIYNTLSEIVDIEGGENIA